MAHFIFGQVSGMMVCKYRRVWLYTRLNVLTEATVYVFKQHTNSYRCKRVFFMFQLYTSQDCMIFVEQYRTSQKEFWYAAPYRPCVIQDEAIIAWRGVSAEAMVMENCRKTPDNLLCNI